MSIPDDSSVFDSDVLIVAKNGVRKIKNGKTTSLVKDGKRVVPKKSTKKQNNEKPNPEKTDQQNNQKVNAKKRGYRNKEGLAKVRERRERRQQKEAQAQYINQSPEELEKKLKKRTTKATFETLGADISHGVPAKKGSKNGSKAESLKNKPKEDILSPLAY